MNWKRKELKKSAKVTIKKNYWSILIVCFIVGIVASGYSTSSVELNLPNEGVKYLVPQTLSEGIEDLSNNIRNERILKEVNKGENAIKEYVAQTKKEATEIEDYFNLRNATEGAIATIINNSAGSNSFTVGIINTVNKFLFGGTVLEGTMMAVATALLAVFWVFIQNILRVGECRFFLETKLYTGSDASRLLFVYRIKKTIHVAWVMFARFAVIGLWSLTIVGGPIAYYAYSMVPYILAENPEVSRRDAMKLSKAMMKGNKWSAFKLELSFIPWELLSLLTLGVLNYVYINPYVSATWSELYLYLRKKAIVDDIPLAHLMNDRYLVERPYAYTGETYPTEMFYIPEARKHDVTKLDYEREYSVSSYIIIFFSISFVGWIWEVFLHILKTGTFVNRGTLIGPWLPIYGTGCLLILILLKPLRKNPYVFFPGVFVVCGLLEYFTSWALEALFNEKWWDYTNTFFNINGRVCFEGLLFFAVGGSLVVYFIAPLIDEAVSYIPPEKQRTLCALLIAVFAVDVAHGAMYPNMGEGITSNISFSPRVLTSVFRKFRSQSIK